jgi:putative ABC transport system permease protein
VRLAIRNLFQDRTRLALSVAGVSLAVMLVLLLSGFVDGIDRQIGQFADRTPGEIVVAQEDVDTLLVATSSLPPGTEERARAVDGVAEVVPVVSRLTVLDLHGTKRAAYLVGYDPVRGGGPWRMAEGREPQSDDEIVVDRAIAAAHDLALGDSVSVLGRDLRVVGISRGVTTWMLSYVFVRTGAAESLLRAPGIASYVFVRTAAGVPAEAVRDRLAALPGVNAELKETMVANDQRFFTRYFTPPIRLMAAIAFLVGALVVGIVLYSATIERRREYGVLKAIGARGSVLYRVALTQALVVTAAGALIGIAIALGAAELIMEARPQFLIAYAPDTVAAALAAGAAMALLATLLPARVIAATAPAEVFRR